MNLEQSFEKKQLLIDLLEIITIVIIAWMIACQLMTKVIK